MGNPIKVNAVGVDEWDNVVEEDKSIPEKITVAEDGKFYIYNAEQLAEIRNNINSGATYSYGGQLLKYSDADYIQKADIDLSEFTPWEPIGFEKENQFSGTYDGGNYKISNLTIEGFSGTSSSPSYGLFGTIASSSIIMNVNITNIKTSGNYVGGIVGTTGSGTTIKNCSVQGDFGTSESESYYVGGIVQSNGNGNILNCTVNANVQNINGFGGIAYTNGGIISGCVTRGTIAGKKLGGIARSNSGTIAGCYNTASITSTSTGTDYIGGIVYEDGTNANSTIMSCYNCGTLSGASTIGAIIAKVNYNVTISACYFVGDVEYEGVGTGSVTGEALEISDNDWTEEIKLMNNALYDKYKPSETSSYTDEKYNVKYIVNSVAGEEPLILETGAVYTE